jgi:outer membrane protein OmpA-like peptidoglycan-associated protein
MTDAGMGYVAPAVSTGSMDPNVLVFPLDDTMPAPVFDGGMPPLMPPAAEVPFSSPFPDTAAAPPPVMLTLPGAAYEPAAAVNVNGAQIFFPHGSSKLSAAGRQVIDSMAARGGGYITVEGHASARGEAADPVEKRIVNLKMSMDRAFNVSSDLIRKGVPPEAITTTVYGDARPAATEDTSRRVEILTRP